MNQPKLTSVKMAIDKKNLKFNELFPLSKLPESFRDGRSVMIYRDGVNFCCNWRNGEWYFGKDVIRNPTHFLYPRYSTEEAGSGI